MKFIIILVIFIYSTLNASLINDAFNAESNGNKKKALTLYSESCNNNNMQGCFYTGLIYFAGQGIHKNHPKAQKLFLKSCNGGYMNGCYFAGDMYLDSTNNKKRKKSFNLLLKACNGGILGACFSLGNIYINGQLIKQSNGGYMNGCYNLGVFYEEGFGVKKNILKAIQLYKKACNGGIKRACIAYKKYK